MDIPADILRKANSKAFHELKKHRFFEIEEKGSLKTIYLFGSNYKFFFDNGRKVCWFNSKHHYKETCNFYLHTMNKNWNGIFSLPRKIAYDQIIDFLRESGFKDNVFSAKKIGTECKIVCKQVYKVDKLKMAKLFGGFLWKQYDLDIAKTAMKISGIHASSFDYTLVWNNKKEIDETLEKAPSILPIWKEITLLNIYKFANPLEHCSVNSYYVNSHFNYSEKVSNFYSPNIIKTTKSYLENKGLTNAGWKFLLKLPAVSVMRMLCCCGLEFIAKALNWFAYIGVVPRHCLIKRIMIAVNHYERSENMSCLLRVALKKAEKMRGVSNFFDNELSLVLDWFKHSGERQRTLVQSSFTNGVNNCFTNQFSLDHNQRKADWSWFVRQQRVWHEEIHRRREMKNKTIQLQWESLVGELVINDKYKIVPLLSNVDLSEEGRLM